MTIVPIRRRIPAQPIHHGANICPGCQARTFREHGLGCPETAQQRARLAYPAEARIFRGLLIGIPAGAAIYAALIALIGAIA